MFLQYFEGREVARHGLTLRARLLNYSYKEPLDLNLAFVVAVQINVRMVGSLRRRASHGG